jgi:hypothetical protein
MNLRMQAVENDHALKALTDPGGQGAPDESGSPGNHAR